jgi:formylmethanofuran dehydrogenase subunit E
VEFHGHGGPFIVAGLRMGLAALRRLDAKGWFDLRCSVWLRWRPPDSCVIDGIQRSTGCTMGKHNIEVEEGEGIAAEFTKGGENLRITLRREMPKKMWSTLTKKGEEQIVNLIAELIAASDLDLFEIS